MEGCEWMNQILEGKVALVTGAGRGIGKQIALTLAGYGADVILNYRGSKEAAEKTAKAAEEYGRRALVFPCNVADSEAVKQMIEAGTKEFGRIDILVNNAGITRDNLLMRMSEEEFDLVMDINLKGTFHCIHHIARQMIRQKSGRIINISSVSGVLGNAGQANYCASKAGIIGLTKSAAREFASRGITVNAVAPGFIDTEMTAVLSKEIREDILNRIPMKQFGKTEDIAQTVAFLASDAARYITGQVISVDGGMAM